MKNRTLLVLMTILNREMHVWSYVMYFIFRFIKSCMLQLYTWIVASFSDDTGSLVYISKTCLANSVRLACLSLQAVLLIHKWVVGLLALRENRRDDTRATTHSVLVPEFYKSVFRPIFHSLRGDLLLVLLNLLGIERVERLDGELEVGNEGIAARLGEVFAHDDAQHLHLLRVWRHGVGGDDPAALAELMGAVVIVSGGFCELRTRHLHSELIIMLVEILI
jgi:hypothetical protein